MPLDLIGTSPNLNPRGRANRTVTHMSNGDLLVCVLRDNWFDFFRGTRGGSWSKILTFEPRLPVHSKHYSIARAWGVNDRIFLVYNSAPRYPRYTEFSWSGSNLVVDGPEGTVDTLAVNEEPSGSWVGSMDVDVTQGNFPLVLYKVLTPGGQYRHKVFIRTSGNNWQNILDVAGAPQGNDPEAYGTTKISVDSQGTVSNVQNFLAAWTEGSSGPNRIVRSSINVSTFSSPSTATIDNNAFGGYTDSAVRTLGVHSVAPGEWMVGGSMGPGRNFEVHAALVGLSDYIGDPIKQQVSMGGSVSSKTFAPVGSGRMLFIASDRSTSRLDALTVRYNNEWDAPRIGSIHGLEQIETHEPHTVRGDANRLTGALDPYYFAYTVFSPGSRAVIVGYNRDARPPSSVSPSHGSVVDRDTPELRAGMVGGWFGSIPGRVEWRLAKNSTFTNEERRYWSHEDGEYKTTPWSKRVPEEERLHQALWYRTARYQDPWGNVSGWASPIRSFTVSHPPRAIPISPLDTFGIDLGDPVVRFEWEFKDSEPTDYQTAYEVRYRPSDGSAPAVSTGKVSSEDSFADVSLVGLENLDGKFLSWEVRLWDRDDVRGPWSEPKEFRVGLPPSVTITQPEDSATIESPSPFVSWTAEHTGGRTAKAHLIQFAEADTGLIVFSSGWRQGAGTSYTPPPDVPLLNERDYLLRVSVQDSWDLIGAAEVTVTTAWVPPPAPEWITVDSEAYEETGYFILQWAVPTEGVDPDFYAWRIYVREVGESRWLLSGEVHSPDLLEFYEGLGGAGVEIEFAVVQVADRFGSRVESDKTTTTGIGFIHNYWLIHPTNPDLSMRLMYVVGDDYDDEWEEESITLIGRGRKREYGEHWGREGTLEVQIRDDNLRGRTARQQRRQLERLKEDTPICYVKNPFGDVFRVALGNVAVRRVSGVGNREFVDLNIPYAEIKQ